MCSRRGRTSGADLSSSRALKPIPLPLTSCPAADSGHRALVRAAPGKALPGHGHTRSSGSADRAALPRAGRSLSLPAVGSERPRAADAASCDRPGVLILLAPGPRVQIHSKPSRGRLTAGAPLPSPRLPGVFMITLHTEG